jgi:hypothetical protein
MNDDERVLIYGRLGELERACKNLQFQNDALLNRCRTLDLELQFAATCLFGVVAYLFGVVWWHAIILVLVFLLIEYFAIARRERSWGDWS